MNANALINMVIRQVTRVLINKGVSKGIDYASRRGKRHADMTPEERARAQALRTQGGPARRLLRTARRFGRF